MQRPPGEQRRAHARTAPTDESRRAEAQAHLDGRRVRLQAYADSLAAALAAGPPDEQRRRLENELAQAQRGVRSASRPRVPQGQPQPRPVGARAVQPDHPADGWEDAIG